MFANDDFQQNIPVWTSFFLGFQSRFVFKNMGFHPKNRLREVKQMQQLLSNMSNDCEMEKN